MRALPDGLSYCAARAAPGRFVTALGRSRPATRQSTTRPARRRAMSQTPAPTALLADGDYGLFEGAREDRVVFEHYRRHGHFSPRIVDLIVRLLDGRAGTFLDVGANIGLITVPVAEQSRARCLAFEPEPRNFDFLSRNVHRHGLAGGVEAFRVALHSQRQTLSLALSTDNFGDHRVDAGRGNDGRHQVSVRGECLDDLLADRELAGPVVMKIDTQGSELRILLGAERTLRSVDYLILEYWPAGLVRMGDRAEALQAVLRNFSHGAVLGQCEEASALRTLDEVFEQLAWVATDGSDEGFFDLLLSRAAG